MGTMRWILLVVAYIMWIATHTNGQCLLSVVFPLDEDLREVRLSKSATTDVTVEIRITCTTENDFPTGDTSVVFGIISTDYVFTDETPRVTIPSGETAVTYMIPVEATGMVDPEQFIVRILPMGNNILPDIENNVLTFNLELLSEVSFDEPIPNVGQLGDVITVALVRTEPIADEATVTVEELGTSFLSPIPATLTFQANEATATLTVSITDHGPALEEEATLGIDLPSSSPSLLLTRDPDRANAIVNILNPPSLAVQYANLALSASSTRANFVIEISEPFHRDITITLVYEGEVIYSDAPSTVVLPAHAERLTVPLTINPQDDNMEHSFIVRMFSATDSINIDENRDQTTFVLHVADVLISIPQRRFRVAEGETFSVGLIADRTAPSEIVVDLFTPNLGDSAQLEALPDAVIGQGRTNSLVGITVFNDDIPEDESTVTVEFRSKTVGAMVDPVEDYVVVIIPANQGRAIAPRIDDDNVVPAGDNDGDDGDDAAPQSDTLSSGALIGIVLGGVGALLLLLAMIALMCCLLICCCGSGGYGKHDHAYPRPYYFYGPGYPSEAVVYDVEY